MQNTFGTMQIKPRRFAFNHLFTFTQPSASLCSWAGGYYLTSAYGAMSLIRNFQEEQAARVLSSETRDTLHQWHRRRTTQRSAPSIDDFQVKTVAFKCLLQSVVNLQRISKSWINWSTGLILFFLNLIANKINDSNKLLCTTCNCKVTCKCPHIVKNYFQRISSYKDPFLYLIDETILAVQPLNTLVRRVSSPLKLAVIIMSIKDCWMADTIHNLPEKSSASGIIVFPQK